MHFNVEPATTNSFGHLIGRFKATPKEQFPQRWLLLEAAHVVGQTRIRPHLQVHFLMLGLALETRVTSEVFGQLFRLVLVPLGHAFGRLPIGNSGRSNVSAFKPMPPSPEVLQTISESHSEKS